MSENTTQLPEPGLELPAAAPTVRITAGIGSAAQKTWNIRRPITLIGSRRPAHIVLHDQGVNRAHCVIVNTGAEILIKDLHTSEGTFRNKNRIELAILNDGDIITVGETRIQVAIQATANNSDDSGYGVEVEDPLKFPEPVMIRQADNDTRWRLEEAVALVGRHESSAICLDHEEVSARHAVIFRFLDRPAIFDLGSRTGLIVNNERCNLGRLREGSQFVIGPFIMGVGAAVVVPNNAPAAKAPSQPSKEKPAAESQAKNIAIPGAPKMASAPPSAATPPPKPTAPALDMGAVMGGTDPVRSLSQIESELSTLQRGLTESWERLNSWQTRLLADANALNKQEHNLATREADVDAKDAELRGQLHDLTRIQEQLVEREKDLSEQAAQMRAQQDAVELLQQSCAERESDVAKKSEELQRREHVFAQRWSRLLAAKCPHCGKPVSTPDQKK